MGDVLKKVHERKIQILAFANNHYAGIRARHDRRIQDVVGTRAPIKYLNWRK